MWIREVCAIDPAQKPLHTGKRIQREKLSVRSPFRSVSLPRCVKDVSDGQLQSWPIKVTDLLPGGEECYLAFYNIAQPLHA